MVTRCDKLSCRRSNNNRGKHNRSRAPWQDACTCPRHVFFELVSEQVSVISRIFNCTTTVHRPSQNRQGSSCKMENRVRSRRGLIFWCPYVPFPLLSFVWSSFERGNIFAQVVNLCSFLGTLQVRWLFNFGRYIRHHMTSLDHYGWAHGPWLDHQSSSSTYMTGFPGRVHCPMPSGFRAACCKRSCALWWHRKGQEQIDSRHIGCRMLKASTAVGLIMWWRFGEVEKT